VFIVADINQIQQHFEFDLEGFTSTTSTIWFDDQSTDVIEIVWLPA